jgi:hypothetical protein
MAKKKKISPLTKALLKTAGDMRKAGLIDRSAHEKIALRHGRSTGKLEGQIDDDVWVIDAFQKKSKTGIKTPRMDVDRIKERIKRLKEALR